MLNAPPRNNICFKLRGRSAYCTSVLKRIVTWRCILNAPPRDNICFKLRGRSAYCTSILKLIITWRCMLNVPPRENICSKLLGRSAYCTSVLKRIVTLRCMFHAPPWKGRNKWVISISILNRETREALAYVRRPTNSDTISALSYGAGQLIAPLCKN